MSGCGGRPGTIHARERSGRRGPRLGRPWRQGGRAGVFELHLTFIGRDTARTRSPDVVWMRVRSGARGWTAGCPGAPRLERGCAAYLLGLVEEQRADEDVGRVAANDVSRRRLRVRRAHVPRHRHLGAALQRPSLVRLRPARAHQNVPLTRPRFASDVALHARRTSSRLPR